MTKILRYFFCFPLVSGCFRRPSTFTWIREDDRVEVLDFTRLRGRKSNLISRYDREEADVANVIRSNESFQRNFYFYFKRLANEVHQILETIRSVIWSGAQILRNRLLWPFDILHKVQADNKRRVTTSESPPSLCRSYFSHSTVNWSFT